MRRLVVADEVGEELEREDREEVDRNHVDR